MKAIDKNEYYSIKRLHEIKAIPWIANFRTLQQFITKQRKIFKPIIQGVGNGKRYLVKGENVIKFLDKAKKEGMIL